MLPVIERERKRKKETEKEREKERDNEFARKGNEILTGGKRIKW